MVAWKRHIRAVIMGLGKSLCARIRYGLPQYPCSGVWGEMCKYVVMCPEGEAALTDETKCFRSPEVLALPYFFCLRAFGLEMGLNCEIRF